MADLRSMIAYLVAQYPHPSELSKARLTKMVYLADWKSAVESGHQMSEITWKFNHFGPYVDDVYRIAVEDPAFEVKSEQTAFGNPKERIQLANKSIEWNLTKAEEDMLQHVIEETKKLMWEPFIQLVYSTFPVMTGARGSDLDLVASAEAYKSF